MTFPLRKSAAGEPAREALPAGGGLYALLRKELADQLNSNRFLLLFGLLAVAPSPPPPTGPAARISST